MNKNDGSGGSNFTMRDYNSEQKKIIKCYKDCFSTKFTIDHKNCTISRDLFLLLKLNEKTVICQKFNPEITVNLETDFFKNGVSLQLELFDSIQEKTYIWTQDGPIYPKNNPRSITIELLDADYPDIQFKYTSE